VTDRAPVLAPAIPWQMATVTAIVQQTPTITSFFFTLAQPFAFQAGQHVDLRLTAPDGYRAMRSYSIASAPGDGTTIELAIERVANGEVSSFFHDTVIVGDTIELRGPLGGYFLWPGASAGAVLLVGGGSGIVPLMSMVRHRHAAGETRPALLLYSARSASDLLYHDELLALDARHDGFTLVITLTREKALRPGDYDRRIDNHMVSDVLRRFGHRPSNAFICGANAFVNAAADGAVAAGIREDAIHTERYGT
jgi:ferredoxin-NADP reductase